MKYLSSLLFLLCLLATPAKAQQRSVALTIEVTSVAGDDLAGQPVTLMQTDYQVSYGSLKLDAAGQCKLNIYPGGHNLSIERDGFAPVSYDFIVGSDETQRTVSISLTEKTRTPFALTAKVSHNVYDGTNSIAATWNQEAPAFFDDFEGYAPFAVSFGEWTGIDADLEAAAPLLGIYPNRGVMQYAQIINPLTVEPTWWYDYPILRPYDGQQYVGFTRTNSGNQNDDWLISPTITVGTDNVLQFMGKAADRYPERFMVYVTEQLEQPAVEDFVRIDKDNYEVADYRGWHQYSYDLSDYAGKQIKFAIRYISHYNRYGSFMLMVDDVYVGQSRSSASSPSRPALHRSPMNPNEHFNVYLDGQLQGSTEGYDYLLTGVSTGTHTLGVQAVYMQAESEIATLQVDIPAADYAHVVFQVSANSVLTADGQVLSLTSMATTETYELTIADGKAELASLPNGQYVVNIAEGAFEEYQQVIEVSGDTTIDIVLNDHILAPYNITATADEDGIYTLRWNQELIFSDSFEDYDDFVTDEFGGWLTMDADRQPVYPIALGGASNIVSFPGSGTASNPTALAPMVFNPWHTTPAMMPADPAIAAPTGDKTVIFFSAQRARNDKWLISPLLDIHEGYKLSVKAKGYSSMYPESMEFCISGGSDQPADFTVLSEASPLSAEAWSLYETDLAPYAGQTVRLAVHYTSYDAFLAQIDDFTVGPESGMGEMVDYGNVVRFEIFVDGVKVGESSSPTFVLPPLPAGTHVVGIKAVYQNGESELSETVITSDITAVQTVTDERHCSTDCYTLQGQKVKVPVKGVTLVRQHGKTIKVLK